MPRRHRKHVSTRYLSNTFADICIAAIIANERTILHHLIYHQSPLPVPIPSPAPPPHSELNTNKHDNTYSANNPHTCVLHKHSCYLCVIQPAFDMEFCYKKNSVTAV